VNPNMTFIAQLVTFYKRLYEESFDALTVSPRVFLVSSATPDDPFRITCRLLMDDLYQGRSTDRTLDPRGMFIIMSKNKLYLWKGSQMLS
jgi:hypothetical protein